MSTYIFDQAWEAERRRLSSLEQLCDETSRRHLLQRGLAPGWRCLEVGCGAGSMALWLAEQVGPTGHVLATDLDVRFMEGHGRDNLEVRRQDVITDSLPADAFDLAHARALLEHLPRRAQALSNIVTAVRPGGWVLVESVDFAPPAISSLMCYVSPPEHAPLIQKAYRSTLGLFTRMGADAGFGTSLPAALAAAGLEHIGAEVRAPILQGAPEPGWMPLTMQQLRAHHVAAGLLTDSEVDEVLRLCGDPSFSYPPPFMVSAWGRRPPG